MAAPVIEGFAKTISTGGSGASAQVDATIPASVASGSSR